MSVLLWLSLLATLALGVALATSAEPPAAGALHEKLKMTRAAESAADTGDDQHWRRSPTGRPCPAGGRRRRRSPMAPPGVRAVGGVTLDLRGRDQPAHLWPRHAVRRRGHDGVGDGRPWGVRNPRWQLLVHQPLADLDAAAGAVCPCYLVAWVADDPADDDGDPLRDAPPGVEGHGVLLVRGAAFGGLRGGGRGGSAGGAAVPAIACRVRRHSRAVLGRGARRRSLTVVSGGAVPST